MKIISLTTAVVTLAAMIFNIYDSNWILALVFLNYTAMFILVFYTESSADVWRKAYYRLRDDLKRMANSIFEEYANENKELHTKIGTWTRDEEGNVKFTKKNEQ